MTEGGRGGILQKYRKAPFEVQNPSVYTILEKVTLSYVFHKNGTLVTNLQ